MLDYKQSQNRNNGGSAYIDRGRDWGSYQDVGENNSDADEAIAKPMIIPRTEKSGRQHNDNTYRRNCCSNHHDKRIIQYVGERLTMRTV